MFNFSSKVRKIKDITEEEEKKRCIYCSLSDNILIGDLV